MYFVKYMRSTGVTFIICDHCLELRNQRGLGGSYIGTDGIFCDYCGRKRADTDADAVARKLQEASDE